MLTEPAFVTSGETGTDGECICCGATSWHLQFVADSEYKRDCTFIRCESCGLVTLDAPPDKEMIAEGYDEAYHGEGATKLVRALHGVRVRHAETKAARVAPMCGPGRRRLFDVGCGEGLFVNAMLELGWDVDANEIGPMALRRAQRLTNRQFFNRDLLKIPVEEGTYDAVTMWQVFEHLAQPVETLQKAYRMLKTDGLLTVSVPNAQSWQARLFGRHWFHLDPPRHLYLFSPPNLRTLLRKHGFEPFLEVRNPLEFGPFGYVQSAMNATRIQRDALFELLKTAGSNGRTMHVRGAMLVGLAAMLSPAGMAMSLIEAAAGRSATFELYARKRAPR